MLPFSDYKTAVLGDGMSLVHYLLEYGYFVISDHWDETVLTTCVK